MAGGRQQRTENGEVQAELRRPREIGGAVAGGGDACEIRPAVELPELLRREVKAVGADRTSQFLIVVDQHAGPCRAASEGHDGACEWQPLRCCQRLVAQLQQA
jgi:hypothetical protein